MRDSRGGSGLPGQYRHGRSASALVTLLLLFGAAWGLNGHTTALIATELFGWTYAQGWALHAVMTVVELSLPLVLPLIRGVPHEGLVAALIGIATVLVGVFDVWSFASWAYGVTGAAVTVESAVVVTLVGELFSMAPEPVIVAMVVALWRLRRNTGGGPA